MNRNVIIRKAFGIFLLAMFALSNTPTKYLHILFANHKDFVSKTITDSNTPQFNVTGLNCHCESNVVIAPYLMLPIEAVIPAAPLLKNYYTVLIGKNIFSQPLSFGLRGPPSFV